MQNVRLEIAQQAEKYDDKGLQTAVNLAQAKIGQLGIEQFDSVSLALTVGTTEITFAAQKIEDEPDDSDAES